jgi:ComF family protein
MAIGKNIIDVSGRVLNLVLPPRCVVSGEEVDRQGMIAPHIWSKLDFVIAPYCDKCGIPFEFDTGTGTQHCASCIQKTPEYDSCRSALKYNDASRDMILGFKHADKLYAALAFMPWLKAAGADMLSNADLIIPVPLHRWRLISRRYNQAAILAQRLSKETGIPVSVDALSRTRHTPSQGHLKAGERAKNVRRAFGLHPNREALVSDKNIVLIDDVYTTGSTVNECAKVLKRAKAAKVDVLTIARVVRE